MNKIKMTCPFTGIEFDALQNADGSLIVQNPLTGENMRIGYNKPAKRFLVDDRQFRYIKTVSLSEAAKILGITRARISKMVKDDVIPHYMVNSRHVFLYDDIMLYKENRKVGRPAKE